MKKTLLLILFSVTATCMMAQPAKRRTATPKATATQQNSTAASDRFSIMFPTSDAMPEDVVWKRDLYRELDLTKDKNAALYYPVMPIGNQCNLFTYLFRLMLTGRVNAYDYNMTGTESFNAKDKVDLKVFLSRYSIYYEEKNGKIEVADADVPSEMVKRYYLKESSYLDQRTGTMHTKVIAICPILLEGGEFGEDIATPKPLFWMKYDDVAPYLAKLPVMSSDLNNVTRMTADDYFTLCRYEGKIYKTNNMQGKNIADYCTNDSAQLAESKRIDKQLTDFENRLWGHKDKKDSVRNAKETDKVVAAAERKGRRRTASTEEASDSKSIAKAQAKDGKESGEESATELVQTSETEEKATPAEETKQKASRTRRTNSKVKKTDTDDSPAPRSSARRQRR